MSTDVEQFIEHLMPSGERCFYRDENHSYWRDCAKGKGIGRLTGISTVASPIDFRPDRLMRWAARSNGTGIAMLASAALDLEDAEAIRTELGWLTDSDSIWQTLEAQSLTYNDLRDAAGDRGTEVHVHALHELAKGNPVPAYDSLSDEAHGHVQGVVEFWLSEDPEVTHAEQVVVDLTLGIAGRFDLRAYLPKRKATAMLDLKTGWIATKHHVQVAGYEHSARVSGIPPTDEQLILKVDEQGGYELLPVRATTEDFLATVDLYRRSARIEREARADRA